MLNLTLKNLKNNHQYLLYKDRCPECGHQELVTDAENGELFCFKCGLVLKDHLPTKNSEWRAYTPEDKKQMERVGLPINLTLYNMGLQTTFYTNRDKYGKILPNNTKGTITCPRVGEGTKSPGAGACSVRGSFSSPSL